METVFYNNKIQKNLAFSPENKIYFQFEYERQIQTVQQVVNKIVLCNKNTSIANDSQTTHKNG